LKIIRNKITKEGFQTPGCQNLLGGFNIRKISTQDDRFSSKNSTKNHNMDFLSPISPRRNRKKPSPQNFGEAKEQSDSKNSSKCSKGGCSSPSGTS
jgi:hypothetical protein